MKVAFKDTVQPERMNKRLAKLLFIILKTKNVPEMEEYFELMIFIFDKTEATLFQGDYEAFGAEAVAIVVALYSFPRLRRVDRMRRRFE